ncbi:MAG: cyclodeaminase/cyclohydrolase family protein [Firmicutes bacterium]|nr:cyclodeaminase/cyclohydrolase family protein [Candidatus Colivicinus equi]
MKEKDLKTFTEVAASKDPVPGGGGVSGYVASLAAALAEMVTNLTIGKAKYIMYTSELEAIKREADILRNNLLDCVDKDAEAFLPLAEAYKLDKNSEGYTEKMDECLKNAAIPPLYILKYSCRIVDLDERLARIGSKISVSDAGTSVMLAQGAMYGAFLNIKVNTRLMADKEYAQNLEDEALKLLDEYSVKALNVYDDVCKRLS